MDSDLDLRGKMKELSISNGIQIDPEVEEKKEKEKKMRKSRKRGNDEVKKEKN
jgi:hypothetical protein